MNVFHFAIIAYLAVNLCGCGYKADPFYSMESCIDSANLVVDCFGNSCESPRNDEIIARIARKTIEGIAVEVLYL